jgi:hypothetical protein
MSGFAMSSTGIIAAYTSSVSESISNAFHQDTGIYTQSLMINTTDGGWLYNGTTQFYINRNTPSGRNMYSNGVMSQYGGFRTYSYQHWPNRVYFDLNINNNNADDIEFNCEVQDAVGATWTNVFNYTQFGPGTYNSGLSTAPFTPGDPNAGWRYRFSVNNLTNPGTGNLSIIVVDYDYNTSVYNNGGLLDFTDVFNAGGYQVPNKWDFNVN